MSTIQNKLQKISQSISYVLKHSWTKTIFGLTLTYTPAGTLYPGQRAVFFASNGSTVLFRLRRGAGVVDLDSYEKETVRIMNEISAEISKQNALKHY